MNALVKIGIVIGLASLLSGRRSAIGNKLYDSVKIKERGRVEKYWGDLKKELDTRKYIGVSEVKNGKEYFDVNEGIRVFNLYGVEFGNWMSQADRMNFYYSSMVSLTDLSKILGITRNQIGLKNSLSLALGARGNGGNVAAFYQPRPYEVINLTKPSGMGALAHEYAHAIDFYLAKKYKKGVVVVPSGYRTTRKQVDSDILNGNKTRPEYYFEKLFESLYWNDEKPTDFHKKLQGKGKYNESRVEVWARTFEVYINMKLKEKGIKNNFLQSGGLGTDVYPSEALIKKCNYWIQKIINITYN